MKKKLTDFPYLKFLNETMIKDPILEKFMEKATEFEKAVGPPPAQKAVVK